MDDDEDREALRRRLYRPGASEEDRRRYAGTLRTAPVAAAEPGSRAARRASAVLPVLAGIALVAVAVAVVVGRVAAAPPADPVARAVPPSPTARTILPSQRVGVTVDGLATTAVRIEGSGSVDVPLDPAGAPFDGGRMTVILAATDARPVGWTASALETRRDWSSYRRVVASSPVRDRSGVPRPDSVRYADAPPRWIAVQAPADAGWTLTVAFTDGTDAVLR